MELGVGAGVTQGWGQGQGQGPGPGSGWSILSAYTFGAEIGAQHILQPARRVDVHHGGGALLDNVRIRVHQLGCGRHGLTAHASGSGWAKCGALAGYPRQLGGVLHWARIRQRGGYPRSYATVRVLGGGEGAWQCGRPPRCQCADLLLRVGYPRRWEGWRWVQGRQTGGRLQSSARAKVRAQGVARDSVAAVKAAAVRPTRTVLFGVAREGQPL